jgi:pyridoxine/pyridoxamine 5'-phosphate oxidase
MDLLSTWLSKQARQEPHAPRALKLAAAFQKLQERTRIVDGYNLDRRTQTLDALALVDDALKAA